MALRFLRSLNSMFVYLPCAHLHAGRSNRRMPSIGFHNRPLKCPPYHENFQPSEDRELHNLLIMWDFSISLWPRRVAALTIPMSGQKDLQSESIVYESPTTSSRTLDDYASTKPSPQDTIRLLTKPWPSRPQVLQKGMGGWRWWDSTVDFVMLLVPLPFFILAASVFAVNGNEVDDYELSVLEQAIKGVRLPSPIYNCLC